MLRSLALPNRYPSVEPLEVFKGDPTSGVFGLRHDTLADTMVLDGSKAGLLTRNFLKPTFSTSSATQLKSLPVRGIPLTDSLYLFPRLKLAVGVHRKVADAKIHTKPAIRVNGRAIRDIHGHEKVELAFSVNEVSLSADTFESCSMVGTNSTWNKDSTIQRKDRDPVQAVLECIEPLVIRERTEGIEFGELGLVPLVNFADFANGPHSMLRREPETLSDLVVKEFLKLELIRRPKLECFLSDPRAGFIGTTKRRQKSCLLGFIGQELHGSNQLHIVVRRISKSSTPRRALPPRPEGRGFRADTKVNRAGSPNMNPTMDGLFYWLGVAGYGLQSRAYLRFTGEGCRIGKPYWWGVGLANSQVGVRHYLVPDCR